MEKNAPIIVIHSRFVNFSLNSNVEIKEENKIVPPEIIGNCMDAGTLAAACNSKKLPVYVIAPKKIKTIIVFKFKICFV